MDIKEDALIVAGVAVGLIAIAWYAKNKISDAAGAVGDALGEVVPYVNPADSRNVVNQSFGKVYQWGGGSSAGIGSDVYDVVHDGWNWEKAGNNIWNNGVNAIGATMTGDKNFTLGGWIYDKTH